MHRSPLFFCLPLFVVGTAIADPMPGPLEAALNRSLDGPAYTFSMRFRESDLDLEGRVDPTAMEGERIRLTNAELADLDEEVQAEIRSMDADTEGDIWCAKMGELVSGPVELLEETADELTYAFTPKAEDKDDEKVFKHLKGEITIWQDEPDIKSLRLYAPSPFKPVFVAKLTEFDLSVTCNRAPDGRAYHSKVRTRVKGSAMGQAFDQDEFQEIYDLEPIEPQ